MKSFKKVYVIEAPASAVFEALTNAAAIAKWSGAPAKMYALTGTVFSLWDGSILGKNISISEEEIVQDWKENHWESFSRVTFTLKPQKKRTLVHLSHEGIPDDSFESIREGWDTYYMLPLKAHVEELHSAS